MNLFNEPEVVELKLPKEPEPIILPEHVTPEMLTIEPVSYTHLDVYKRQFVEWDIC